jgi:hypothetical protein
VSPSERDGDAMSAAPCSMALNMILEGIIKRGILFTNPNNLVRMLMILFWSSKFTFKEILYVLETGGRKMGLIIKRKPST